MAFACMKKTRFVKLAAMSFRRARARVCVAVLLEGCGFLTETWGFELNLKSEADPASP